MLLDEIDAVSPFYKLDVLNRKLRGSHGLNLDFNAIQNENELHETLKKCEDVKYNIVKTTPFNNYMQNEQYTCECLIQEAISVYLAEILPFRRTKRKMKSGVNK